METSLAAVLDLRLKEFLKMVGGHSDLRLRGLGKKNPKDLWGRNRAAQEESKAPRGKRAADPPWHPRFFHPKKLHRTLYLKEKKRAGERPR